MSAAVPAASGARRDHGSVSVAARLRTLSVTLAGLMLIITVAGLVGLQQIRSAAEMNIGLVGPAADANRDVRDLMLESQSAARGYLLLPAGERRSDEGRAMLDRFHGNRARVAARRAELHTYLDSRAYDGGPEEMQLRALVHEQETAEDAWWGTVTPAVDAARLPAAQFAEGRRRFARFLEINDRVDTVLVARRYQLRQAVRDIAVWTSWSVLAATLVAVVAALVVGHRTSAQVTRPIVALRDTLARQRSGDRSARADETSGVVEIRELAADVNALAVVYGRFLDEQRISLRAQTAETATTRAIRETGDTVGAVRATVAGIAEGLELTRAACATFGSAGVLDHAAVSVRRDGAEADVRELDLPDGVGRALGRVVSAMWAERRSVVLQPDQPDEATRRTVAAMLGISGEGGLIIRPFGLGDRPIGVIVAAHDDPDRRWYESTIASITHIAGEVVTKVVAGEDEASRAEHVRRLEDLDRQKNDFMSTVSHELRTPLTSISGYLEMLEDGDAGELTAQQRAMLDVVDRNALRLRALIEDLLVLNRMEAAVTTTHSEVVDMGALVADTVEEIGPAAAKGGVRVTTDLHAGPLMVQGDHLQLGRALTNVISNAVKFTPSGGSVDVAVTGVDDGEYRAVEVRCTDTGIGIPAEDQEKLFTRFFRAGNATAAQVPGTGLGLVVVQGIVERHHGRLELTSVEGEGTTVRIVIPLHPRAAVAQAVVAAVEATAEAAAEVAAEVARGEHER